MRKAGKRPRSQEKGSGRGRKAKALREDRARRPAPPRRAVRGARGSWAPARAAPAPDLPDPSRPRAVAIARAGLDKKAEDVLVLDLRGLTSYADYFVLMTADSDRQAVAIADHVEETLRAQGAAKVGVEGYESGRWILVDYGDVVAHVLSREARGFYDLEGLWADAPRVQVG